MRTIKATFLGLAFLGAAVTASWAAEPSYAPNASHLSLQYPGGPKAQPETPKTPYALNYTDQMAQSLGVHDGRMDFSGNRADSRLPTVSGGLGGGGPMVRLQWHP